MKPSLKTGSIVILGFCLLLTLAITGIGTIYFELIKSQKPSKDCTDLKKELFNLSNTLTTMYEAEGTAQLLAFAENKKLELEYDSLTYRVFDQIDSLRIISTNPTISLSLDSLSVLLAKKRDNAKEMFRLMKQMDKNIAIEITKRTIISSNDIDKLNSLLAKITQVNEDTVHVVAEKKGFISRLKNVFKSNNDTLVHISAGSVSETKNLLVPVLSDTIVDFFRTLDKSAQKKNAEIVKQMLAHQHNLYIIKELTSLQINNIMDTMKEMGYQMNENILKERYESLKRSTSLVAVVGLSALIVSIFFISWTLYSLHKERQLQKNIQKANKRSKKLLTSREQLIYTITHDIKAPLSSIIGFLDLLISEGTLSKQQRYYVDNMYSSASHIHDLVRNLLDFHSMEKEKPQLASIAFSPTSLINSIYESFLPLTQKKKLAFVLKSTFPETKTFLGDPYCIRQIVNNLLSNAVKFTPKYGRVSLISSSVEQNRWKISVKDNGLGINPADQTKIFKEFVRLEQQTDEIEGTGLGLTISKKLATLLGGTIEVESQKGAGSVFTLIIPLTPVVQVSNFPAVLTSGRVLFVDDDRTLLSLFSEWMKKDGVPYVCCSEAYEALSLLREQSFDIIFTDIHIPDMEGFELVKRVRESNFPHAATIPIIACSAVFKKSETELKSAGFTGFLLKPFNLKQLWEIIEKYTSIKRKTDESFPEKNELKWKTGLLDFVVGDQEAVVRIIDSFIEETNKDRENLKIAFQKNNDKAIKQISHKMLSLMRMISAQEIITILAGFEMNGTESKEKGETLFRLLDETIKKAEIERQKGGGIKKINN